MNTDALDYHAICRRLERAASGMDLSHCEIRLRQAKTKREQLVYSTRFWLDNAIRPRFSDQSAKDFRECREYALSVALEKVTALENE